MLKRSVTKAAKAILWGSDETQCALERRVFLLAGTRELDQPCTEVRSHAMLAYMVCAAQHLERNPLTDGQRV